MPAKDDTRVSHDKQRHHKIGEPVGEIDWEARCRLLSARDAVRAKELLKAHSKARGWHQESERQRKRADEANANAARFHALLLQERVRKIGADT